MCAGRMPLTKKIGRAPDKSKIGTIYAQTNAGVFISLMAMEAACLLKIGVYSRRAFISYFRVKYSLSDQLYLV